MKILKENETMKLYISDKKEFDFNDTDALENYFKDLFIRLKQNLNLSFTGLYDIHIYLDDLYGAIIELKKEDLEYIDYYDNEIDMRIIVHDSKFLYQVEDFLDFPLQYIKNIYFYKNHFYLEPSDTIEHSKFIKILEMSDIIYQTDTILKYGKKVRQSFQTML